MTGNDSKRTLITERDRQLLSYLAEAKLLDREQIQHLLDFGSITRANDRLSKLHAAGFLNKYFVGTAAGGRKGLYVVTSRGASIVGHEKVWRLRYSQSELLIGEPFVEHQFAVNWCWISAKNSPNPSLVRFVRFNEPISPAAPLIPDGYLEMNGRDGTHSIFLEVDLTTETSRVWDRKVELYLNLAASGEFERTFHQQRFKVAVVCTTQRRLDGLRRVVRKHTPKLFYFALLEIIKRDGMCASHWLRPEGYAYQPIV